MSDHTLTAGWAVVDTVSANHGEVRSTVTPFSSKDAAVRNLVNATRRYGLNRTRSGEQVARYPRGLVIVSDEREHPIFGVVSRRREWEVFGPGLVAVDWVHELRSR